MADKLSTATNIQIQQKTASGMVAYHPETNSDIVKNNSTAISGDTLTDILDNSLSLISSDESLDISVGEQHYIDLKVKSQLPTGGTAGQVLQSNGSTSSWANPVIAELNSTAGQYDLHTAIGTTDTTTIYNKTGTDSAITTAINNLNYADTVQSNYYVTAVVQEHGKITVSKKQINYSEINGAYNSTITIAPGTGDHTFTTNNSAAKTVYVDTYSRADIDQKIVAQTNYLGSVASAADVAALTPDSEGDFARASATFTYDSKTIHAGDILICDSIDPVSWEIIHTESDTWVQNTKDTDGYVLKGSGNASKVWKTDANGNPGWRDDADTTYSVVTKDTDGLAPNIANHTSSSSVPSVGYVLYATSMGSTSWAKLPDNAYLNTTYTAGAGLVLSGTTFTPKLQSSTAATVAAVTQSAPTANTKLYPVRLDSSNQLSVYVPWENTQYNSALTIKGNGTTATTYYPSAASSINFAAGNGISCTAASGTITISNNTQIQSGTNASGSTITGTYNSLGNSGVTAGTYSAVSVNTKGIVTAGAQVINYYASSETVGSELVTGGFAMVAI